MTPFVQLFVQCIQQNVRQQGRQGASLGSPFFRGYFDAVLEYSRREKRPDDFQHSFVVDVVGYSVHEDVMVDPVEVFLDVQVHYPFVPLFHIPFGCPYRSVSASSGAEPPASIAE